MTVFTEVEGKVSIYRLKLVSWNSSHGAPAAK